MNRSVGIRGAGVAGMSVARELLKRDPTLSITIFDTRARLPHPERTFCFFQFPEDDAPVAPSYSWSAVRFSGHSFDRKIEVPSSPYVMVEGERFFSETLTTLEASGVKFVWSCSDAAVSERTIRTRETGTSYFDLVIDAAFSTSEAKATLWQSFAGVWVTTDADTFDPNTATLMELGSSSAHSPVSFVYVLPTSPRTALVEHTTFSLAPQEPDWHITHCHEWLTANTRGRYEVTGRERGVIPMGVAPSLSNSKFQIGSRAGAIRPATGYAFLSIQEQARSISEEVVLGKRTILRVGAPHPWWTILGDDLFMRALIRSPLDGGTLMGGLLSKASPDTLVRFLSGKARLTEALRVWWCVPKVEMLRALIQGEPGLKEISEPPQCRQPEEGRL